MIVYIQQIRVAGWIRVVLSWLLLYMGTLRVKTINRYEYVDKLSCTDTCGYLLSVYLSTPTN